METFDEGSPVTAIATLWDRVTDALTDPTTVTFNFQRLLPTPVGTLVSFAYPADAEVVRDSVGQFHCDLVGGEPGIWFCEVQAAGALAAVTWDKFEIRASPFP
jgi:hypothetical protein